MSGFKDFLIISLGAILGANLRYWISRFAIREWGVLFPGELSPSMCWAVWWSDFS